MTRLRNLYRAAQFLAWLVLFLLGGCTHAEEMAACARACNVGGGRMLRYSPTTESNHLTCECEYPK